MSRDSKLFCSFYNLVLVISKGPLQSEINFSHIYKSVANMNFPERFQRQVSQIIINIFRLYETVSQYVKPL